MYVNKVVAEALCCKAWGITPKQLKKMAKAGDITLQEVMCSSVIEIASHPLSAEGLTNMLFPKLHESKRESYHSNLNRETFETLLKMKEESLKKEQQKQKINIKE